jgi:hypothetical protein
MGKRRKLLKEESENTIIESLAQQTINVAKKARKYRLSLSGDNFYANKLVELKADATNAFREMTSQSPGDVSAMAEMIEGVFSARTDLKQRTEMSKELIFTLRTTWRDSISKPKTDEDESVFPLGILSETKRSYLVTICRQMNGSFSSGWYDACAVMMRRLLEVSIIEAFENNGLANKIKNPEGNYLDLSDLIKHALKETSWNLSRNTRKFLPQLRDIGHMSAHGRYYCARKPDIEKVRQGCRVVIEEFLHHAKLL